MQAEIEKQSSGVVVLGIQADMDEWQKFLEEAARTISQQAKISGFRKGKAPLAVVVTQVGEATVLSEASDRAVKQLYVKAVLEHQLSPIAPPKISVRTVSLKEPLSFEVEITVVPEVTLGDWKKIKVKPEAVVVDDKRVDDILNKFRRREASFKEVKRAVKQGDWVEIDFDGTLDGQPFDGGSSKHHPLVVGDGVFLPEFEAALVGVKAGEDKKFPVTFPKDYHQASLAGRAVEFTIKLHKVKEMTLPELNDELAKKTSQFKSLAELKGDVEKFIKEEAEGKERDRQRQVVIDKLIDIAKVDLPDTLVEQEMEAMLHDMKHQLEQQGTTPENYFKKMDTTEEKIRGEWREPARKRVMAGLALNAFVKAEGIEASTKDVDAEIKRLKAMYPAEKEKISEKYKNETERKRLQHMLGGQKALEQLVDHATS